MEPTHKSTPRDVFMHLLMVITLYVSAGSLLTLWFRYINLWFPDPLRIDYGSGSAVRWSLAILIILFPVYLWVSRFLEQDIQKNPAKAHLKTRRWLLYFTLFAAAILIIGDLVTLIFNFLEGDLTIPFILKVLAVLLVAGAVFGYYLYSLRKQSGAMSPQVRMFVWIVLVAVLASIVTGFFVAGSPFKQRLVRFDNEKLNHLQILQNEIVTFWQKKDQLPVTIQELENNISGFIPPIDPQTGVVYKYRPTSELSFELCAEFNLSSDETGLEFKNRYAYPEGGIQGSTWEHNAGETCFSRTIDPEFYGLLNSPEKPISIPVMP